MAGMDFGGWSDWSTFEDHYMREMTPRAKSDYIGGELADEKVLLRMSLSNARMDEDHPSRRSLLRKLGVGSSRYQRSTSSIGVLVSTSFPSPVRWIGTSIRILPTPGRPM
jgi:hypothetical protein